MLAGSGQWAPGGSHVLIGGALWPICATKVTNMRGAFTICAMDNSRYFVHGPPGGSHTLIGGAFW
jgi:hypothetical protein